MVNHFEYHHEITTKDSLFKNLLASAQLHKLNVFDYLPLTFVLDVDAQTYNPDFEKFVLSYNIIAAASKSGNPQALKDINSKLQRITFSRDRRAITHCKAKIAATHFAGKNLWILKPTGFNRGRGVSVFDSMDKLRCLLKSYSEGAPEYDPGTTIQPKPRRDEVSTESEGDLTGSRTPISNLSNLPNIIKSKAFVIQKYIERPLLLYGRKFDVRVWVLVTHEMKVFFFPEGYLRTSSEIFSMEGQAIDKRNVHLTNNAVQKYCDHYGKFEDGNQLTFARFQVLLSDASLRSISTKQATTDTSTSVRISFLR
jgi:hypothetical protein